MSRPNGDPNASLWSAAGFADDNRRVFGDSRQVYLRRKAVFLRKLAPDVPWWLEAGAGNGEFAAELISQGCRTLLLDSSLDLLRSFRGASEGLVEADAACLPFPDAGVPGVVCSCLLHHLDDRSLRAFMREAARVLAPGGPLVVFDHNPLHPAVQWLIRMLPYDRDARLVTPRVTKSAMRSAGIEPAGTAWLNTVPASLPSLEWLDKLLSGIPAGTQWAVWGRRPG